MDPATFTLVRLVSGALMLAILARSAGGRRPEGGWLSGAALFAYAIAFSFAYLRLDAGAGALILFGSVQATMIGWGLVKGERPRPAVWLGLVVSLAGLVVLARPGRAAPELGASALMAGAGAAWAAYSLRGRTAADPLATNAANFARSVPLALAVSLVASGAARATPTGVLLAIASGGLTSGLGYAIWYAALRGLTATRAAIVQLAVPVLAAAGGTLFLGERVTLRLVAAGSLVLGGIALSVSARRRA